MDADEHDLPAEAPDPPSAIAVDRVTDPLDAFKSLRVDVEKAARKGVLVALRRVRSPRDSPEPAEAFGSCDGVSPQHRPTG